MKYREIVACFEQAGYPVERIENQAGCIATIAAAARVIALAPDVDSDSFLYNPPAIKNIDALQADLFCADGAPGGDRLWIAPEYQYHWLSEPKDIVGYSNYDVPKQIDPAAYTMRRDGKSVRFNGAISVRNQRSEQDSAMQIERIVTQTECPTEFAGMECVSYQIDQRLSVSQGVAGLWNIVQVPSGSIIVLPLRKPQAPLDYFNPSEFSLTDNACSLCINGQANSKIGYGSDIATPNSAAFYLSGGYLNMVFRHNSVIEEGYYCDGLDEHGLKNQVWQAWDGFGFGELEYHSVAAGKPAGTATVSDTSTLFAVRGDRNSIIELASDLLRLPALELGRILGKI